MSAFAPSAEDLATFSDVDVIAGWLEMEPAVLEALAAAAGARSRTLRTWARIPAARWAEMITNMKVTSDVGVERALSPIEEGQVGDLQSILATLAAGGAPPSTEDQGGAGGTGGAANITEQAAAGAAGAQAAVAPEDVPQGHPGTALP